MAKKVKVLLRIYDAYDIFTLTVTLSKENVTHLSTIRLVKTFINNNRLSSAVLSK